MRIRTGERIVVKKDSMDRGQMRRRKRTMREQCNCYCSWWRWGAIELYWVEMGSK